MSKPSTCPENRDRYNGLQALQTAAIAAALPVSVVLLFMIVGLLKSLARDP